MNFACIPGCLLTDLIPTDAVRQCAESGFANTMRAHSGVVCYNRTTAGSEAVYICYDGFHQDDAARRVCQSDGVWNGSIPQCFTDPGTQDGITLCVTYNQGASQAILLLYFSESSIAWHITK